MLMSGCFSTAANHISAADTLLWGAALCSHGRHAARRSCRGRTGSPAQLSHRSLLVFSCFEMFCL